MTQIITTSDGVEHEFSDNASDAVIKKALQSYSAGTKSKTDQSSKPDIPWISPTFTGTDKIGEWVQTAINSGTFNLADPAQSWINKFTSGPDLATLRARSKAAREDLGTWGATSADVAGRLANPLTRLGGSGIPALMVSGAAQSGVSALGAGEDPTTAAEAAITGGLGGGVAGGVGKYVATPSFVSHAVRRYLPIGAAGTVGYLGGGPTTSALAADAMRRVLPEAPKFVPNADPWLSKWLNSAAQGALSGRFAEDAASK